MRPLNTFLRAAAQNWKLLLLHLSPKLQCRSALKSPSSVYSAPRQTLGQIQVFVWSRAPGFLTFKLPALAIICNSSFRPHFRHWMKWYEYPKKRLIKVSEHMLDKSFAVSLARIGAHMKRFGGPRIDQLALHPHTGNMNKLRREWAKSMTLLSNWFCTKSRAEAK